MADFEDAIRSDRLRLVVLPLFRPLTLSSKFLIKAFQTRLQVSPNDSSTGRKGLKGCGFEDGKKMGRLVASSLESSKEEFDDFGLGILAVGMSDFPYRETTANPTDVREVSIMLIWHGNLPMRSTRVVQQSSFHPFSCAAMRK
jgi:hypothetical protein